MRVPAAAVLALLMATPVLADPPTDVIRNGEMAVPGGSVGATDSPQGTERVSCVQLLERAFYLSDPADLERALDAHHEMELARDAFQDGDEPACKRHAIHALYDRT
jgi:hypothetical protein